MAPTEWYRRGIRLLGRTAVECTRDALGDRIGRSVASVTDELARTIHFTVIDPFAGSCNTLYWILRHVPNSEGLAFESQSRVYELSGYSVARLDRMIELVQGDYQSHIASHPLPPEHGLVIFVAPPWGIALDETKGLDLRLTTPPVADIVAHFKHIYAGRKILFAIQVHEKLNPASLSDVRALLDWSEVQVYDINAAGRNHGLLMGGCDWKP